MLVLVVCSPEFIPFEKEHDLHLHPCRDQATLCTHLFKARTGSKGRRRGKREQDFYFSICWFEGSSIQAAEQLQDSEEWHTAVQISMEEGTEECPALL